MADSGVHIQKMDNFDKEDEDDDELEALRLAALQTIRPRVRNHPPPPSTTGSFFRLTNRPNLIAIIPAGREEQTGPKNVSKKFNSGVRKSASVAQGKETTEEEDKNDKFSRFRDSDSESDDESADEKNTKTEKVEPDSCVAGPAEEQSTEDVLNLNASDDESLDKLMDEMEQEISNVACVKNAKSSEPVVVESSKKVENTTKESSPANGIKTKITNPVGRADSPVRRSSSRSPVRRIARRSPLRRSRSPNFTRRSPVLRRSRSPFSRRSRSPLRARSPLPPRRSPLRRSRSPFRRSSRSPRRSPHSPRRSPIRRLSRSPRRSRSPQRRPVRPYPRRNSRSPLRRLSRSPRRSRSPITRPKSPSRISLSPRRLSPRNDVSPRRRSTSPKPALLRRRSRSLSPRKILTKRNPSPKRLQRPPSPNKESPRSKASLLRHNRPNRSEVRPLLPRHRRRSPPRPTELFTEKRRAGRTSPTLSPHDKTRETRRQVERTITNPEPEPKPEPQQKSEPLDPVLEARRRKFESNKPVEPLNKKIRLNLNSSGDKTTESGIIPESGESRTDETNSKVPEETSHFIQEGGFLHRNRRQRPGGLAASVLAALANRKAQAAEYHRTEPIDEPENNINGEDDSDSIILVDNNIPTIEIDHDTNLEEPDESDNISLAQCIRRTFENVKPKSEGKTKSKRSKSKSTKLQPTVLENVTDIVINPFDEVVGKSHKKDSKSLLSKHKSKRKSKKCQEKLENLAVDEDLFSRNSSDGMDLRAELSRRRRIKQVTANNSGLGGPSCRILKSAFEEAVGATRKTHSREKSVPIVEKPVMEPVRSGSRKTRRVQLIRPETPEESFEIDSEESPQSELSDDDDMVQPVRSSQSGRSILHRSQV